MNADTCERHGIEPGQLTIHAGRGSSMRSKLVAQLLADLGVTKTHSRPHVSNDNPFSESAFKTRKYRRDFPKCFGSIEDARAYCVDFFAWYNGEHRSSNGAAEPIEFQGVASRGANRGRWLSRVSALSDRAHGRKDSNAAESVAMWTEAQHAVRGRDHINVAGNYRKHFGEWPSDPTKYKDQQNFAIAVFSDAGVTNADYRLWNPLFKLTTLGAARFETLVPKLTSWREAVDRLLIATTNVEGSYCLSKRCGHA